jgi:hypothetical protein
MRLHAGSTAKINSSILLNNTHQQDCLEQDRGAYDPTGGKYYEAHEGDTAKGVW